MGDFVTDPTTTLADLLPDGEKSTAPGVSYRPGWTSDNVLRAVEVNAIANALLDVRTALRERVDVTHYGALGDGATDDSAAFELAIAAANGTGIVYVPAGTYRLADVDVQIASTTFEGEGRDVSILQLKTLSALDGSAMFAVAAADVTFRKLTLDGRNTSQPADGFADSYNGGAGGLGRAYRALITGDSQATGLTVELCRMRNAYGACVATNDAEFVTVRHCIAEDNYFELAFLYGTAAYGSTTYRQGHVIEHNHTTNTGSGHATVNANAVVVRKGQDCRVSSNTFIQQERNAVKFEHCRDSRIHGNVVRTTTQTPDAQEFGAFQLWGSGLNISIVGNTLQDCAAGMHMPFNNSGLGIENVVVANNVIEATTGPTIGDAISITGAHPFIRNVVIQANTIRSPQRYGIRIQGVMTRISILGNAIGDAGSVALYLQASGGNASDILIEGNHLDTDGANGALRLEQAAAETIARLTVCGNNITSGSVAVNEVTNPIVTSGRFMYNQVTGSVTLRGTWYRDVPIGRSVPTWANPTAINAALGDFFEVVATGGGAFQISAPTNPQTNQAITIRVKNSSGGALGGTVWSAAFKMAAWADPANGFSRSITFCYDGTNWIEVCRTTADIPN